MTERHNFGFLGFLRNDRNFQAKFFALCSEKFSVFFKIKFLAITVHLKKFEAFSFINWKRWSLTQWTTCLTLTADRKLNYYTSTIQLVRKVAFAVMIISLFF